MAFDETNIWVTTGNSQVMEFSASTGATLRTVYAVATVQWGGNIAFDGANIWVAGSAVGGHFVTKIQVSSGTILGSFKVGDDPEGVVFDGTNIWVTNSTDGTVSKLLASTGALVGTYPAANLLFGASLSGYRPAGIAFDGVNIWIADYGTGSLTKLLAATGQALETNYHIGSSPMGLVFDGLHIWAVNNIAAGTVTKFLPAAQ